MKSHAQIGDHKFLKILTCFIRSRSPKPLDRTLIYYYDIIKPGWLRPEKMQLVKINPCASRHSPQLLIRIPWSQDTERCWFPAKMLINPRGMGEAALLPVCKNRVPICHLFGFYINSVGCGPICGQNLPLRRRQSSSCVSQQTHQTHSTQQPGSITLWFVTAGNTGFYCFLIFQTSTDLPFLF